MLSIEKCKKVLNKKGEKYTTEQTKEIRKILYVISEIIYDEKDIKDEKVKK